MVRRLSARRHAIVASRAGSLDLRMIDDANVAPLRRLMTRAAIIGYPRVRR
jgi:hypothetical protein